VGSVAIVITIILILIGIAGTIFPFLPGVPVIFIAIVGYGWYEGFNVIDVRYLLIMGGITVLALLVDYLSSVMGAKYFGSSKKGIWGALIGTFIGIFFIPPFGIIVGPWLGAVVGEYWELNDINRALKVGLGTVVGLLSGMFFKIVLALIMTITFVIKII